MANNMSFLTRSFELWGRNEILITNKCKDPAKLLKWIWINSTRMMPAFKTLWILCALHLKRWFRKCRFLAPKMVNLPMNGLGSIPFDFGPKYVSDDINSHVDIDQTQGGGLKLKMDENWNNAFCQHIKCHLLSRRIRLRLSSIYVDINSYVTQQASKWGDQRRGRRKDWDSLQSNLEEDGHWWLLWRFNRMPLIVTKRSEVTGV